MGLLDQNSYAGYAQEGQRLAVEPMSFTPMDAARFVAEATPIIGDAMAAKEVYDELQKPDPNYAMVAALGGAALVGLVPGLGDAMASGIKKGARGLLDTAKRIEVDPNALGMSGGNIRLKPKSDFDVTRKDASGTFGEGSERVRYTDPKSKSTMEIVVRPDGSASVLDLVVPEGSRGKGLGQSMQAQVMQDFPMMGGQVSSKAAATTAYRLGRRPVGQPDATLDDVFAAIDDMSSVNLVSPDMQKKLTPSLPAPRNEAEAIAKQVLELRASGNARDVTEKMMDAADDQYMFKNTPIPMDVSSRMARADQMNPRKGFHGTSADIKGFEGNVFSTDNPTLASTYARGISDGQIYPLRLGSKFGDTIVEGDGADWHKMNISDIKDPAVQAWLDWAEGQKISTREIENAARKEGRSGVQFKNIKDTGPGINSSQFKNIGYTKEQERDLQRQYMKDLSNPSNVDVRLSPNLVRSQFARFDPEFKHLKNLTAAGLLAPGVLASMQEYKKQQELERGLLSY